MSFDYREPTTLDEVLHLVSGDEDTFVVAGGSATAVLVRLGLLRPRRLVSLRRVAELRGVTADAGGLTLGATTTLREVEMSSVVRTFAPALATACSVVATVRIRNQATIGGNVVHADPAQDPPPMLIALGAAATLASPNGTREVPLDGFFSGWFETVRTPEEVLVGIRVPPSAHGARATYTKFLPRTADDYATVSVAACVRRDGERERIVDARVVLGAVGATPIRSRRVEDALVGRPPSTADVDEIAALVRDEIDPVDDARGTASYKREMARVWTARAIREVVR